MGKYQMHFCAPYPARMWPIHGEEGKPFPKLSLVTADSCVNEQCNVIRIFTDTQLFEYERIQIPSLHIIDSG